MWYLIVLLPVSCFWIFISIVVPAISVRAEINQQLVDGAMFSALSLLPDCDLAENTFRSATSGADLTVKFECLSAGHIRAIWRDDMRQLLNLLSFASDLELGGFAEGRLDVGKVVIILDEITDPDLSRESGCGSFEQRENRAISASLIQYFINAGATRVWSLYREYEQLKRVDSAETGKFEWTDDCFKNQSEANIEAAQSKSIVSLPSKVWSLIGEGLSLWVEPSQELTLILLSSASELELENSENLYFQIEQINRWAHAANIKLNIFWVCSDASGVSLSESKMSAFQGQQYGINIQFLPLSDVDSRSHQLPYLLANAATSVYLSK